MGFTPNDSVSVLGGCSARVPVRGPTDPTPPPLHEVRPGGPSLPPGAPRKAPAQPPTADAAASGKARSRRKRGLRGTEGARKYCAYSPARTDSKSSSYRKEARAAGGGLRRGVMTEELQQRALQYS